MGLPFSVLSGFQFCFFLSKPLLLIDILPRGPALTAVPWLLCGAALWQLRAGGVGGMQGSKSEGHGRQRPAPGALSPAVSAWQGTHPLCACFLLCRVNTSIPPALQGCPEEVRQLMSSAGKKIQDARASSAALAVVTQSGLPRGGPIGILARPSPLGWVCRQS